MDHRLASWRWPRGPRHWRRPGLPCAGAGWPASRSRSPHEKAARIVADARTQQKDLILEAKDEKIRLQREAEDEARASAQRARPTSSAGCLQRDEQLDQRADMLEQRDRKLLERSASSTRRREELAKLNQERSPPWSGSSSLSAEDAKAHAPRGGPRGGRARRRQARPLDRAPGARGGRREGPRHHRHRDAAGRRRPHRRAHGDASSTCRTTR